MFSWRFESSYPHQFENEIPNGISFSILRDEIEDGLDTFYCTFCGTKVIFESQSNAAYRAKVELKEMQHDEIMLEKRIEQEKYLIELKQKAFVKK